MPGRRLLCVDDEEVIRITLAAILEKHGFQVTTAANVAEALQKITSEQFDVLLSDLNIGNPGDGLTVVGAMRRTQPEAVTIILTGYPAFETALEAIRQQVDEYVVKPANVPALLHAIESKLAQPPRERQLPAPKRVCILLREHLDRLEQLWISALKNDRALAHAPGTIEQRCRYARGLLEQIIRSEQPCSADVAQHSVTAAGPRQYQQTGYTPGMVLAEVSHLRRAVAQVVQENLLAVNLSYLVPDLARVNECLDEQALAALEMLV